MPGLNLTSLLHFREIARHEHVGRAAEQLRVAQPSLSRSLSGLEAELGVQLFDRVGRRLRLNAYGTVFLGRVEAALRMLDDGVLEAREAAGLEHGRVRVASETLLTLARMASSFRRTHPGVDLRLHQAFARPMARLLEQGEVDVCLASVRLEGRDLHHRELLREPVLLAVPPEHPWAGRDRAVEVAELADQDFVVTRPGCWQRTLLDRVAAEAGFVPRLACESDEPGATQDLVAAGLGVAFVPEMSRAVDSRAPVAWLEVDDPACERVLLATWRAETYLSRATRTFIDHAARHWGR